MNRKVVFPAIFGLLFSGMGFMLLLVMVIFERSAFDLLFNIDAGESEAVLEVFGAIRMVINVLPYVLGPFILGTFIFGFIQTYRSNWKFLPTLSLIAYTIPIIYNITFADSVGVVETLRSTNDQHTMEAIRYATQGVMRQHHIGIIGFGFFLVCQIMFIVQLLKKDVDK